jgi:PBP1b-binding outer membrane lipoprotein LpoB
MKAVLLIVAAALLLVGCEERYRYPCQDPENKDNPECNRPQCETDGFCYDQLNGIEEQVVVVEQAPCDSETEVVEETTGE